MLRYIIILKCCACAGVVELCLPYLGHSSEPQAGGTQPASQSSNGGGGGAEDLRERLPPLLAGALRARAAVATALALPCMHLWGSSDAHACVLRGALEGATQLRSLDLLQVCYQLCAIFVFNTPTNGPSYCASRMTPRLLYHCALRRLCKPVCSYQ